MTVVVFERVALGFEDVSVLVFHLPPCSTDIIGRTPIQPA
jgi:hypothetical protein